MPTKKWSVPVHVHVAGEITEQCIGGTTRFIHDRIREHINNENSSVKETHIHSCQNEDYKGIEVQIIMSENDPANLRLYEAFYIRKYKPTAQFPRRMYWICRPTIFNILF